MRVVIQTMASLATKRHVSAHATIQPSMSQTQDRRLMLLASGSDRSGLPERPANLTVP